MQAAKLKFQRPRVLLIWPGHLPEPAMGLLAVGSELARAGLEVAIIHPNEAQRADQQALQELLRSHLSPHTLWVGLTVMTPMIPLALRISALVRRLAPQAKIVWGGPHPTLFPEQTAAHPLVDLAVVGDGEASALEFSDCLLSRRPMGSVAGLAFKVGGRVVRTPPRPHTDPTQLGMPDYDLYQGLEAFYSQPTQKDYWSVRLLPVYSASGCPFRCAFCINTVLKKPWKAKSALQLVDECRMLIERYDLEGISFVDELFFAGKKRVMEMIELKRARGLDFQWAASCSVHTLRNYSDEELAWCRDNGWVSTGLGVESGSPEQLKRLNKRITLAQVVEVAARMERLGVDCSYSFLIGAPHETRSDMAATLRLMLAIKHASPRRALIYWAQIFRPYPGSVLYDQALELGFTPPADLEGWGEMAGDEHNGFTRCQDLPWLDIGAQGVISELNLCVSVYLKRMEAAYPAPEHTVNIPGMGKVPIGSIFFDIALERFSRYPPVPPLAAPGAAPAFMPNVMAGSEAAFSSSVCQARP